MSSIAASEPGGRAVDKARAMFAAEAPIVTRPLGRAGVFVVTVPAVILLVMTFYYFHFHSTAQVPLDYPDDPTFGNAAEDTELQLTPTETGEDRVVV